MIKIMNLHVHDSEIETVPA